MRRTLLASALLCIFMPLAHGQNQSPPNLAPVRVTLPDSSLQAIVLQSVDMKSQIFANHARTVVTVVLRNPNNRVLEGNFEFPLLAEQHVSGFALDINGKLRAASSVPKARAQEVFEDIRRIRADPGLLEKDAGNVYRLRVYPIPAQGTRTVQITIDQQLTVNDSALSFRLPMSFSSAIENFNLNVTSANRSVIEVTHGLSVQNPVTNSPAGLVISAKNYSISDWLELSVPNQAGPQWQTENKDHKNYVLGQLPIDGQKIALQAPRVLPNNIDVFWDASNSSADGQTARALAVLEAYFRLLLDSKIQPNVTVHLIRNEVATLDTITLTRSNLNSLLELLQKTPRDGATRLDGLTPKDSSDLVILVSDGLATFGETEIKVAGKAPVYTLNTGIKNNVLSLRKLADSRHGAVLDLTQGSSETTVKQAVDALTQQHAFVKRVSSANLSEIIYPQTTINQPSFSFAAQLKESKGSVRIELEDAIGATHLLDYVLPTIQADGTMAAQQWAQWKIDDLSSNVSSHRKQMEQLSGDFGLVTDSSSLLVLETANDYAQYHIKPPVELEAEVNAILAEQKTIQTEDRNQHLDGVIEEFNEKQLWWNKNFPKTRAPAEKKQKDISPAAAVSTNDTRMGIVGNEDLGNGSSAVYQAEANMAPAPALSAGADGVPVNQQVGRANATASAVNSIALGANSVALGAGTVAVDAEKTATGTINTATDSVSGTRYFKANSGDGEVYADGSVASSGYSVAATAAPAPALAAAAPVTPAQEAPLNQTTIQLKPWEPNAPYIARFKASADADLYQVYLDERVAYAQSTAFYLDVADIFNQRHQPELAIRILSNLAEMNLDNRDVLRILSYRLIQFKQAKAAIPFLTRVTELAPNEPQSWRDLGLAYAETGADQKAIINLWKVVSEPWDDRFPGVEQIALNELNAIAARAKKPVDTQFVDPRLKKNMPVDLRAVLSWDADDTDIDLWITDPLGERVYYGNSLSRQGGRISNDFTGGYGPEEFLLKNAIPGKYKVEANFYGHRQQTIAPATSLMLKLTTHFGRKEQKDQNVILRLSGEAEEVFVGEFTVR